jgi:hypothetical protein
MRSKSRWALLAVTIVAFCGQALLADADSADALPEQVKAWRAEGPAAVDRLMAEREKLIGEAEKVPGKERYTLADKFVVQNEAERAAWKRVQQISNTIDRVAGAKYSHVSGLYWYTDEAEAMRVAKEQGKPVLALRLLGNLDEELSCANSRYFRVLLYPDEAVRKLLHDKFVLTWKSVRPVPKITIDFGDGRKVERTITGNSVHYVLLPDGQIVDVFPGLYAPKPFVKRLEKAAAAAGLAIDANTPAVVLAAYRVEQIAELKRAWESDVKKYDALQSQSRRPAELSDVGCAPSSPRDFWATIADVHPEYAELGKASRELLQHEAVVGYYASIDSPEHRVATKHGDRVIPALSWIKGGDEAILGMFMHCVTPALQADTLFNEYSGRNWALRWLEHSPRERLEEMNDRLYDMVFGYHPNDPWAGLSRLESLTALPKDRGVINAGSDTEYTMSGSISDE